MTERAILHSMDNRDRWACAWSDYMNFVAGGEDGLGEGRGLYGTREAITYEYSNGLEMAVWRNSEGVHVAPVENGEK